MEMKQNNTSMKDYYFTVSIFCILIATVVFLHILMQELQELHSALEEAKADIVGLWALKFLINQVSD
jgi:hypothetical protein